MGGAFIMPTPIGAARAAMAGSVSPFWSDPYTLDHWIYVDSTGAEYQLTINNNGIWTSNEGIYLSFDSNAQKLYFPDGSFWLMNCESGGSEPDAGSLYPTVVQDTNGNQLSRAHYNGLYAQQRFMRSNATASRFGAKLIQISFS
jgi:hypothetical protein